jgi:hypothetical protein
MVLIKPVESFVLETLLMLEYERINRRQSFRQPKGKPISVA